MCFTIQRDKNKTAKIAKKDIRTYKVLVNIQTDSKGNLKGRSYLRMFWWKEKVLLERKLGISDSRRFIDEGLHSFSTLSKASVRITDTNWDERVICECIIPKGAEYYINTFLELVVSTQMYWTGRVYSASSKRWVKFGNKLK